MTELWRNKDYWKPTDDPVIQAVFERERKRLGIEDKEILVEEAVGLGALTSGSTHTACKVGENSYRIRLHPRAMFTDETLRRAARHELAHVAFGHCDTEPKIRNPTLKKLYYYLFAEPMAQIYEKL